MKNLLPLLLFVALGLTALFAQPARVIPYYSGENPSFFDIGHPWDPLDVKEYLHYREFTYDEKDHLIDFRLMPKKDMRENGLKLWCPRGITPAQRIVYRMRNLGKSPFRFVGTWGTSREGELVGTSSWHGWSFPDVLELPPDGDWHDLSFHVDPERLGEKSGVTLSRLPLFKPFGFLSIYPQLLRANEEVHIQIASIHGEDDVTCNGDLHWNGEFPTEMTAGTTVALPGFRVDFRGRTPLEPGVRLVFQRLKTPEGQKTTPEEEQPLEFPLEEGLLRETASWTLPPQNYALTKFLLAGEYRVVLECGDAILTNAEFRVRISARPAPGFRTFDVRPFGGRQTIHCDGEPLPGVMRATYTTEGPKGIRAFTEAGIQVFGFCGTPTDGGYNLDTITEYAPGKCEWAQFERRMRNVLDTNPEALVVVRLDLYVPQWWAQAHPDDIVQVGYPNDPTGKTFPFYWNQGKACPSWASTAWREYTCQGLRRMMAYLQKSPYADHIAGFVLASGTTEEWMEWASSQGVLADYSPASQNAFRRWLTRKYSTDQALQEAWGDDSATRATATQPTPYERSSAKQPGLRDPNAPLTRRIADYNRYHSDNVAECIQECASAIKESTDNKLLVGAFYGYYLELAGGSRMNDFGHLGVGKTILTSPDLDFLCSPTGYGMRGVGGDGMPYPMGAADSLQLHGKFWFVEHDVRTSATPNTHYGRPEDIPGDILQQTKESMHTLLTGMAQWWFDVGYIRYSDPEVMECIRQCVDAMKEVTLNHSREPVAQVAFVLDEASADWTTPDSAITAHFLRNFQRTLSSMGTPYELYLTDDLARLPERIRLVVLPMSISWTPEQRDALQAFRRDGRAVLFIGTPGAVTAKRNADRNAEASDFTGLPLGFAVTSDRAEIVLDTPDGDWLDDSLNGQKLFPGSWCEAPNKTLLCFLRDGEDPTVKSFGHFLKANGKSSDPARGALGVKESPDGAIAFSYTEKVPREFLERLYEKAGIHRYLLSEDQVWATKDAIAACVKEGGMKMLRLSRPCTRLRDLFTGETFPVDPEGVACIEFQPRQTRAFVVE